MNSVLSLNPAFVPVPVLQAPGGPSVPHYPATPSSDPVAYKKLKNKLKKIGLASGRSCSFTKNKKLLRKDEMVAYLAKHGRKSTGDKEEVAKRYVRLLWGQLSTRYQDALPYMIDALGLSAKFINPAAPIIQLVYTAFPAWILLRIKPCKDEKYQRNAATGYKFAWVLRSNPEGPVAYTYADTNDAVFGQYPVMRQLLHSYSA